MYRIRSPDGAEAVYNSLEEFTAAVRRGEVAPDDEIFHQRANRWLDVKSHPHYRSAMNWSGQGLPSAGAKVSAPPASVSTPPPRPAVTTNGHAPPHGHPAHGSDRLGLSRPVPPTVYRAQVESPKPAPTPPAQAQPPKSKDLAFIDLGTPAKQGTPSNQKAASPPAATQPPAPSKPVNELDFLVMATGLEAPVRKSNGHKTVTEDLDLLFDTPVRNATPPAAPAAVSLPASGAMLPPPPVEPAKPRVSAPRPAIVEPPKLEAPRHPVVNLALTLEPAESDMGIPNSALLETSLPDGVHPAHPVHTPAPKADKTGLMIGTAAVVMVVTGVLLVWRPWSRGSDGTDVVTTSSSTSQPSAPPAGLMPQGLVAGAASESATTAVPAPDSATAMAAPGDSAAQADSAAVAAAEEIIATSRPEFNAPVEMAAPDLTPGAATSEPAAPAAVVVPMELVKRLEAAERQAHQDLVARLIGFRNVLGSYRLDTREGITQARGVWNGGADAIRQYRARIGRLEQAYEDSVLASQRAQRWSGEEMRRWATRRSLAEPAETSQLADLMFSQVGEALDILAAMEGQYEVKGNIIRFRNPASGSRFVMVRTWVEQRMGNWATTPESARPFTVTAILQALGEGLPAVE